jgi:hypothetical protein
MGALYRGPICELSKTVECRSVCIKPLTWGSLCRIEWGTGANTFLLRDEFFAVGQPDIDMDTFEAMMGRTSSTARWREDSKRS